MLGVNDRYVNNVKATLSLLDKYGIKVAIHSILTQKNSTEKDFTSIFEFINNLSNILYWKPDLGAESVYVNESIRGTIAPSKSAQASILLLCNNKKKGDVIVPCQEEYNTNTLSSVIIVLEDIKEAIIELLK